MLVGPTRSLAAGGQGLYEQSTRTHRSVFKNDRVWPKRSLPTGRGLRSEASQGGLEVVRVFTASILMLAARAEGL